jgi:hypothetical protein
MKITLHPIDDNDEWSGSTWEIPDEDNLAEALARVAIGQSRVIERILSETGDLPPSFPKGGYSGARRLLTVKAGDEPYHRDGWIFQLISWMAAHSRGANDLIRAPHMIHAHKGLDGLSVEFDAEKITQVVISEDKATENPRKVVRDKVWPEFKEFEADMRDNELVDSVTSLLVAAAHPSPDETVAAIMWQKKRGYRVAVTVGEKHATIVGGKNLYRGYADAVAGNVGRRRAETLYIVDLRPWFARIAAKAIVIINSEEVNALV